MNPQNKKNIGVGALLFLIITFGFFVLVSQGDIYRQEANIFQSIKHFFSNQKQSSGIVPNDHIVALQDELFDPSVVYLKLTEASTRIYRQKNKLPRELHSLLKNYSRVTHASTAHPLTNPTHPLSYWVTFDFQSVKDAQDFLARARYVGEVTDYTLDWKQEIQIVPNDEFYQTDSEESLWGHEMIRVQDLWDVIENPGQGVVVGVLDTGVSNSGTFNDGYTHADLLGAEWYNTNEIPNNGIDDDNNGYVDDYLGGFAPNTFPSYEDQRGHGTHVAGTIAARGNNSIGFPGIAFDATLLPFKFSNYGMWSVETSVSGIVYAVDQGADVINNSWSGTYNQLVADAVLYAHEADAVVISSAGNGNGSHTCAVTPAGSEYSFSVASLQADATISPFSSIGTTVDLAAPGGNNAGDVFISQEKILSTKTTSSLPGYNILPIVLDEQGNEYVSMNGTSMAAPHVSAAAAIIRQQRPDWNNEQIYSALRYMTDDSGTYFADGYGHGILDLSKITELPDIMPVANLYEPRNCAGVVAGIPGGLPLRFSAYVPGAPVPDLVRVEVAEGAEVSENDFILIAELQNETIDDVGYSIDVSGWDTGLYTIRVVTEYGDIVVDDRNQISIMKSWDLIPFGTSTYVPSLSANGQYMVTSNGKLYETNIIEPYGANFVQILENNSSDFEISDDSQFVVFSSHDSNLVLDDTNNVQDIFVYSRAEETMERVSVSSEGVEATDNSSAPSISSNGRFIAFASSASNLVPDDTNGVTDIFVHDRESGTTERISVSSEGIQGGGSSIAPSISSNGRFIAFASSASNLVLDDTNGVTDIFVHDRESGTTERVSVSSEGIQSNNSSSSLAISGNGRFIAFASSASNLVPDDANDFADIFVHDRESGITERVSISSEGVESNGVSSTPTISADGNYIVFTSYADNFVFGDINGVRDIVIHNRELGTTEIISVDDEGGLGEADSLFPDISADGNYVAFYSSAYNFPPYEIEDARILFVALHNTICFGDFNQDGFINILDFMSMLSSFESMVGDLHYDSIADFNNDGIVNSIDMLAFLNVFGESCDGDAYDGLINNESFVWKTRHPNIAIDVEYTTLQAFGFSASQTYNTKIHITNIGNTPQENIAITSPFSNLTLVNNFADTPNVVLLEGSVIIPHIKPQESQTIYLTLQANNKTCQQISSMVQVKDFGFCER